MEPLQIFTRLPYPMEFNEYRRIIGGGKWGTSSLNKSIATYQKEVVSAIRQQLSPDFRMYDKKVKILPIIQPFKNRKGGDADGFMDKYLMDAFHSSYNHQMKEPELKRAMIFENDSRATNLPVRPLELPTKFKQRPNDCVDVFLFQFPKRDWQDLFEYGTFLNQCINYVASYYVLEDQSDV